MRYIDRMAYQIEYDPAQPLPHIVYERGDLNIVREWRKTPKEWRASFASEAEAHMWIRARSAQA